VTISETEAFRDDEERRAFLSATIRLIEGE
jgi:hypothetical protein